MKNVWVINNQLLNIPSHVPATEALGSPETLFPPLSPQLTPGYLEPDLEKEARWEVLEQCEHFELEMKKILKFVEETHLRFGNQTNFLIDCNYGTTSKTSNVNMS